MTHALPLTRRRFLTVSAAALLCSGPLSAAGAPTAHWSGQALGARTSMQLVGLPEDEARPIFRAVEHELARLERIFSLYRSDSQLVQLNGTGRLTAPAPEMLEVLSLCTGLHDATGGAFDPTLQPLWLAHAGAAGQGRAATAADIDAARALIGWQNVIIDADEIRLAVPGMALTLNGVAQGYVTDRIAALLRQRGLTDVLIDMGEIAALGKRETGEDWTAGIAMPDGTLVHRIKLSDRALATSAPEGTLLDRETGIGHILDPRLRAAPPAHRLVSVSAQQAAIADGLSTAGCLLNEAELKQAIAAFPQARLETLI